MKVAIISVFLILFYSQMRQNNSVFQNSSFVEQNTQDQQLDSLFKLNINDEENVRITLPKKIDFELPDSTININVAEIADFNADNKKDVMLYLGACGTGGCMYGIFLKQYDDYYKMAFFEYLKGAEFNKEKNGTLSITSMEVIRPYDPSEVYVTKFKFDSKKYEYVLDTTYIDYN